MKDTENNAKEAKMGSEETNGTWICPECGYRCYAFSGDDSRERPICPKCESGKLLADFFGKLD